MQSTQHYIDNERNFLASIVEEHPAEVIQFKTAILPVVEQVEVDVDIEKQIRQLQEARINQGIKKVVPVDFDIELGSFFSSISQEKEQLEEKVKKEAKTISGLEDLFKKLSTVKKKKVVKKKQILLVEPEKQKEVVNEVRVAEKEAAGSIMEYLLPKEVAEYDEDIIGQVSKQISEMQVATELDKDKIKGLKSIDSLDKLKTEFINFKDIVARQMGTIGGGGEVRLEFLDDVQKSTAVVDGKFLKYSSSDGKFIGADASASEFSGVTAGTVTASKGVIVDSNKDIDGFRNVTIEGNLTVEGTTTTIDSTTIEIQNSFKFEGATDDAYETNLTTVDPTADRTVSLPNATGTIVLKDTTDTLTNKSIDSDNNTITNLVNADIKAAAAIAFSKMANLTVSRLLVSDGSGDVSVSAVTSTEAGYLDGVTSAIQTQIDGNTTLTNTKATKAFAIAQAVALG